MPDDVLRTLHTSWDGLTPEEAATRLRCRAEAPSSGANAGMVRSFVAQFTHFFALTLWVAAGLALVGQLPELATAIVLVVVVNGLFSFAQEFRAERATRALAALMPAKTLVRRAGERVYVDASEIVDGDLLLLEEGARVCADARVLSACSLRVDNSALTGESEPVYRTSQRPPHRPGEVLDADNVVFAGSWVVSGSAEAVVIAAGRRSRLGALSQLTRRVVRRATPLHEAMNRAVRTVGAIALGTGATFVVVSVLLGMPLHDSLLFSVGVIVALVPEGLLPTLTLSLALGATRMTKRGALVRHLEAVETLGCTTVICTDKTGTLTMNQMTVTRAWTFDGALHATGVGYGPTGTVLLDGRPLSATEREEQNALFRAASLCGDARVEQRDARWTSIGDPTEAALLVFARKGGLMREEAERVTPRVGAFPFESARRRMSTIHRLPSGDHLVLTKGSTEAVLPRCVTVRVGSKVRPLRAEDHALVAQEVESSANAGLRVLAIAQKLTDERALSSPEDAESGLEFLGLVAMRDPIRTEVPDAIGHCQRAGIRVLMVTGDHPKTATAIGHAIGLRGRACVGSQLPVDPSALADLLTDPTLTVIARVAPEQKLAIARALQERGEVVAMTGDGVNDAPALRQADIGVAMGKSGTDVAREAADLVLLDDNFSHIVAAVEEGRAAFANIRRFLTYHLTDNVSELAPFLVWAFSFGHVPLFLSVLQVLALDIGTDLLPALALGAEPPEKDAMARPPRAASERLLNRSVLVRSLAYLGPLEALFSLSLVPLGAWLLFGGAPTAPIPSGGPELAMLSTMVFGAIVLMQAANACLTRTIDRPLWSNPPWRNRMLFGAILLELAMLSLFVYEPHLQRLLGHRSLPPSAWGLMLVTPLLLLAVEETRKRCRTLWHQRSESPSPRVLPSC